MKKKKTLYKKKTKHKHEMNETNTKQLAFG